MSPNEPSGLPDLPDAASYWEAKLDSASFLAEIEKIGRARFCAGLGIAESTLSGWLAEDRVPRMAKVAFGELISRRALQDKMARQRAARTAIIRDGERFRVVAIELDSTDVWVGRVLAADVPDEATARTVAAAPRLLETLRTLHQLFGEQMDFDPDDERWPDPDERVLRDALAALGMKCFSEEYLNANLIRTPNALNDIITKIDHMRRGQLVALRIWCEGQLVGDGGTETQTQVRAILALCRAFLDPGGPKARVLKDAVKELDDAPAFEAADNNKAGYRPDVGGDQREFPATRKPSYATTRPVGLRLMKNRDKSDSEVLEICQRDGIATKLGTVKGLRALIGLYEGCDERRKFSPDLAPQSKRAKGVNLQTRIALVWFKNQRKPLRQFLAACKAEGIEAKPSTVRQIWRYFPLCKELLEI